MPECRYCGLETTSLGSKPRTYCDRSCKREWLRQPKPCAGGCGQEVSFGTRCDSCRLPLRRPRIEFENLKKDGSRKARLIDEQGHQCEICMITEWMRRPAPLQLDHIDGNPDNNSRENLRLLCANCHAQTDTYGGANVGKFTGTSRQEKFRRYPTQKYRTRNRTHGVSGAKA